MNFDYTDEQLELARALREFADKEITPHAAEWDDKEQFPADVIKRLGELGFMGVLFPEELGGGALNYQDYAVVIEELARADASVGITVAAHTSLCSNHIYEQGTDAQKETFLKPLASGKWLGGWSLTEPGAGSDAGGTQTTATLDGDEWVLNGSKTFTTNGSKCDVAVAMAVTDKDEGKHGISAFIVPKGTPGFRPGKKERKLGHRASDTSEMIFENCRIPKENLLGKRGEGFVSSLKVLDGGRISIAAMSVGIAQAAYECAPRLRRGAPSVRKAHRFVPGDPLQARRHGDRDRRRASAGPARRVPQGPRTDSEQGVGHGEALRERGRRPGR